MEQHTNIDKNSLKYKLAVLRGTIIGRIQIFNTSLISTLIVWFTVVKAWIKDPVNWRQYLLEEHDAYSKFIAERTKVLSSFESPLEAHQQWVTLLLNETLSQKKEMKFLMPQGNLVNFTDWHIEEQFVVFTNGKGSRHICSLAYAEGACSPASNRQGDMIQSLSGIELGTNRKVIKTSTVVPFNFKGTKENPYVLINDKNLMSFEELNKIIPGRKDG